MSDGAVESQLLQWWRQQDEYQWRIEFLRSRGLLSVLRNLIAAVGATMGTLAALSAFMPPGADGAATRIGWAVVAVGSLGWAARWALLPWPSARGSAALVVFVDIIMTLSTVLPGDPNLAMSGVPLLLCTGGYVVFFHGPRLHLAHIGWCTVCVVSIAAWLASTTPDRGMLLGASRTVILLLVTVCILPALQFGFWLLQGSSMQSLTDPLTGLTNRRGLTVSMKQLNAGARADAHLCVLLIDVDGFKAVNDALGHAGGDDVLVRTARQIRACVHGPAVVVRWGGEEFLVVDRIPVGQGWLLAERIRTAVSAHVRPVITVSIGLATCAHFSSDLGDLIAAADSAMYEAKAYGGNRVALSIDAG